jgi:hypothetical protein
VKAAEEATKVADKDMVDAAAAAKAAAEAKQAAATAKDDAARQAAEKAEAEAAAKAKDAERRKTEAQAKIKELAPKDVNVLFYSNAFTLKVAPTPATVTVGAVPGPLAPGAKLEIPVSIKRLYDFAEAVDLTLVPPQGVAGITAPKVTVAKDQSDAKLSIEAAAGATAGEHQFTLQATLKFNGQDLKSEQPVTVKILAP